MRADCGTQTQRTAVPLQKEPLLFKSNLLAVALLSILILGGLNAKKSHAQSILPGVALSDSTPTPQPNPAPGPTLPDVGPWPSPPQGDGSGSSLLVR
jgi:hypothetical protein